MDASGLEPKSEPLMTDERSAVWEEDPVYRNSRREATFILIVWGCAFIYTIVYCYLFGYQSHEPDPTSTGPSIAAALGPLESFDRTPETLTFPFGLGIPDWVFWGIAVPWLACIVASFGFGLFFFSEDDLGREPEDAQTGGAS